MEKLKKDIERIECEGGFERIIFEIKSYSKLKQMIEKLNSIGYCVNHRGWSMNEDELKAIFYSKSIDSIELILEMKTVYYNENIKFEELSTAHGNIVLNSEDYLKKMKRKKLKL